MEVVTENIDIGAATEADMSHITELAKTFRLDTDNLNCKSFVVAKDGDKIIGFGRLKFHKDFTELGTFAVINEYRHRGVGQLLMNKLTAMAPAEVYLLTTIPEYGYRFGFRLMENVPEFIKPQLELCKKANYPESVSVLYKKKL